MLFTTHAVTGAVVGFASGNPILGFFIGWISHHVLDSLPHFDQGGFQIHKDKGPIWLGAKYKEEGRQFEKKRDWIILFIDFSIATIIGLYFLYHFPSNYWPLLIFGGLGGVFPDILHGSPFWKYKIRKLKIASIIYTIHNFFHWPLSAKYWHLGILIQILIVVINLFFIKTIF